MKIEYRVIPVTRYFVTRFQDDGEGSQSCDPKGEYENKEIAHEVGYALCKAEHDHLGWALGDERISYPDAWLKNAKKVEAEQAA